eukprot:17881-Heterococcus_DN1.PRE.2
MEANTAAKTAATQHKWKRCGFCPIRRVFNRRKYDASALFYFATYSCMHYASTSLRRLWISMSMLTSSRNNFCKYPGHKGQTPFGCKACDFFYHPECFKKYHEQNRIRTLLQTAAATAAVLAKQSAACPH